MMERQNQNQLTRISGNNLGFLAEEERTPEQIVEFLKEGAILREFQDVLRRVYPAADLSVRLTSGIEGITGESHDSVAKKVRNWLSGKSTPQNRETLFQIGFVLGLDEAEVSRLLGAASETGIHYRNPEELVYAYALRTGLSYEDAQHLKERLTQAGVWSWQAEPKPKQKRGRKADTEAPHMYTKQVKAVFGKVRNEDELIRFFREYGDGLGQLHETAYARFVQLLDLLQKPESERDRVQKGRDEDERLYTMSDVIVEYLGMNVPEGKKTSGMTVLQRMIKKYWPNESSLFNMRNRKEDVSRKVMILLYLITEAVDEAAEDEDDYCFEDLEEDPDILLETRIEKMNLFLDTSGMNLLDPGNPFDYLAIYAMRTEDVGAQMAKVLDVLFEGQGRRKKVEENDGEEG